MRTCEHGCKLGESHLPEGGWAGGVGKCECCLGYFGFVDSGAYTQTRSEVVTNDPNRCKKCGGKARRTIVEDGVTIEDIEL